MPGTKRIPVEVIEKAQHALAKSFTIAPEPQTTQAAPAPVKLPRKITREKVVEALRRLHPMD